MSTLRSSCVEEGMTGFDPPPLSTSLRGCGGQEPRPIINFSLHMGMTGFDKENRSYKTAITGLSESPVRSVSDCTNANTVALKFAQAKERLQAALTSVRALEFSTADLVLAA